MCGGPAAVEHHGRRYGAVAVRVLRSYPAPVEVMTPSCLHAVHRSGRAGAHNRPAEVTGAVSARQVMCISTPIQVTVGDPGQQRASQEWQSVRPLAFLLQDRRRCPTPEGRSLSVLRAANGEQASEGGT